MMLEHIDWRVVVSIGEVGELGEAQQRALWEPPQCEVANTVVERASGDGGRAGFNLQ